MRFLCLLCCLGCLGCLDLGALGQLTRHLTSSPLLSCMPWVPWVNSHAISHPPLARTHLLRHNPPPDTHPLLRTHLCDPSTPTPTRCILSGFTRMNFSRKTPSSRRVWRRFAHTSMLCWILFLHTAVLCVLVRAGACVYDCLHASCALLTASVWLVCFIQVIPLPTVMFQGMTLSELTGLLRCFPVTTRAVHAAESTADEFTGV